MTLAKILVTAIFLTRDMRRNFLRTQIYRDLYGDAVLVPIRMGTNMAAGNQQKHLSLRPSSDVVLLPCRTKLQLGSTVARQENNFDSDVVTESNQIQDTLMPRNNSPANSPWERNLAKIQYYNL